MTIPNLFYFFLKLVFNFVLKQIPGFYFVLRDFTKFYIDFR